MAYYALCQSLIDYCITSLGGAARTHLIEIERSQRAILKIAAGLLLFFPPVDLYREWDLLVLKNTLNFSLSLTYSKMKIEKVRYVSA